MLLALPPSKLRYPINSAFPKTNAVLFGLDRETFNNIVKDAASKKREYYEVFLGKVELLQDMDPYERLQIADALKSAKYKKGEHIIKQVQNVLPLTRAKMEQPSTCCKMASALPPRMLAQVSFPKSS
jgi:hypothetical protein